MTLRLRVSAVKCFYLMKEQITGKDRCAYTGKIRQQCAGQCVTHLFYTDTAKINRKDIKGGLGTALHDGRNGGGK